MEFSDARFLVVVAVTQITRAPHPEKAHEMGLNARSRATMGAPHWWDAPPDTWEEYEGMTPEKAGEASDWSAVRLCRRIGRLREGAHAIFHAS